MNEFGRLSVRLVRAADAGLTDILTDLDFGEWDFRVQHGQLGTMQGELGQDLILAIPEDITEGVGHVVAVQSLEPAGGDAVSVLWADADGNASNKQTIPPGGLFVVPSATRLIGFNAPGPSAGVRCRVCVLSPVP